MRNILITLLLLLGFWNCSDNEAGIVHIDLQPSEAFFFTPIPGGAIMHYNLPADPEIIGLEVRYNDALGQEMLRVGGTACDSLQLVGFNEKKESIPAQVILRFYDDRKSQPFNVTFSTEDSAPITFLKSAEVFANWEGFSLRFNNPANATGMAHVFYLGIDPVSQLPDTILVSSFLLEETDGNEIINYRMQQDIKDPTIVVRAEDFRGYIVDEKVWPDVKSLMSEKLSPNNFTFFCDRVIEHTNHKLGVQYLFDGDKKGEILALEENRGKACSFIAGPNSAGEDAAPMYMDLKQNRVLGSVRLYAMYSYEYFGYYGSWEDPYEEGGINLCYGDNSNNLPCEVTIYGLKDDEQAQSTFETMNSKDGWVKLGTFKQDKNLPNKERWPYATRNTYPRRTFSQVQVLPDVFMEVIIPAIEQGDGYRYVKMVINEVLLNPTLPPGQGNINNHNPYNYVQFHELEIYTEKE